MLEEPDYSNAKGAFLILKFEALFLFSDTSSRDFRRSSANLMYSSRGGRLAPPSSLGTWPLINYKHKSIKHIIIAMVQKDEMMCSFHSTLDAQLRSAFWHTSLMSRPDILQQHTPMLNQMITCSNKQVKRNLEKDVKVVKNHNTQDIK